MQLLGSVSYLGQYSGIFPQNGTRWAEEAGSRLCLTSAARRDMPIGFRPTFPPPHSMKLEDEKDDDISLSLSFSFFAPQVPIPRAMVCAATVVNPIKLALTLNLIEADLALVYPFQLATHTCSPRGA